MKKILYILFTLICITSMVHAQPIKYRFDGQLYILTGMNFINTTELNDAVSHSPLEYPKFANTYYPIGGGGMFIIKKWLIIGEAAGFLTPQYSHNDYKTSLSGGYIKMETGYILFEKNNIQIAPLVGVGANSFQFKVSKQYKDIPFSEIINEPQTSMTLNTGGLFFTAALQLNQNIKLNGEGEDSGNLVIGLSAGYTFTPTKPKWTINGSKAALINGPELLMDGPYIKFSFGISGNNFSDDED